MQVRKGIVTAVFFKPFSLLLTGFFLTAGWEVFFFSRAVVLCVDKVGDYCPILLTGMLENVYAHRTNNQ